MRYKTKIISLSAAIIFLAASYFMGGLFTAQKKVDKKAMEPLFTTRPDLERSGMGFAVMQTFMDQVNVESAPGQGTTVRMKKQQQKKI